MQTVTGIVLAIVLASFALLGPATAAPLFATNYGSGGYGGSEKVRICHQERRSVMTNSSAIPGHLRHGDTLGYCEGEIPGQTRN